VPLVPFTVVISAVESALKSVCETVLAGPTGGVDCSGVSCKIRSLLSREPRPCGEMLKHVIPDRVPLLPTQAAN